MMLGATVIVLVLTEWGVMTFLKGTMDDQDSEWIGFLDALMVAVIGTPVLWKMYYSQWAQKLSDGEALHQSVITAMAEGVVVQDREGKIVSANPAAERILGLSAAQMLGRDSMDPQWKMRREDGTSLPGHQSPAMITLHTGLPQRDVILSIERPDGTRSWLRANTEPIHTDHGELRAVVVSFTDVTASVETQRTLSENQQLLRTIIDVLPQRVFWKDLNSHYLGFNAAFASDCGTTDLIGKCDFDMPWSREQSEFFVECDRRVMSSDRAEMNIIEPLKNSQGRDTWLVTNKVPLRDSTGKVFGILGTYQDITAIKMAEHSLEESERRVRLVIDTALDAAISMDEHRQVTDWNTQAERTFGWTRAEAVGRTLEELIIPKEMRTSFANGVRRYLDFGDAHILGKRVELPAIRKDGSPLNVELAVTPVKTGGTTWFSGFVRDITERKRAEKLLLEAKAMLESERERLDMALAGSELGAWDWNVQTGEVKFDRRWAAMIGERPEDLLPHVDEWSKRCHPDDLPIAMKLIERCFRRETDTYECTFRMRHSNGAWRWILDRGKVVSRDERDRPLRMVGTHADVTEQKEREIELARLRDEAESANRAKSQFLANMSHEIRTPLTAIMGYAEVLEEDGDLSAAPPARIEAIKTVRRAGEHLMSIINDILDLSKIEAGRMELDKIEADLPGILRSVESLFLPRAKGKGIDLATRYETPIPTRVIIDPTRIRQVLLNLIGNAVKFTEHGCVTLRVSAESTGGLNFLQIDIEDDGPGLTPAQVAQLFEVFQQGDTSMTRRFGGTGLGLAICRRFARLMGGDVTVARTAIGLGSTFRFSVPIKAAEGSPLAMAPCEPTVAFSTIQPTESLTLHGRILFAEDGPDNQRLISLHLRKAGAQVDLAENGKIAFDMVRAAEAEGQPYDLLLTDMQMPVMDGYELVARLRACGNRMSIVGLTANAMAEDRQKCINAGCNGYATKPIDKRRLLEICNAWIAGGLTATR